MNIKTFKPRKLEIPVTEIEQASFCRLDDNLRSKTLEEEFKSGVKWQKVPLRYLKMKPNEIDSEILKMKAIIGNKLYILGHHYQREEVIKFADTTGDSFKLSLDASKVKDAEYIVFCGCLGWFGSCIRRCSRRCSAASGGAISASAFGFLWVRQQNALCR